MASAKMTGKVKWFNVKKGYGFITVCPSLRNQNLIFHPITVLLDDDLGGNHPNTLCDTIVLGHAAYCKLYPAPHMKCQLWDVADNALIGSFSFHSPTLVAKTFSSIRPPSMRENSPTAHPRCDFTSLNPIKAGHGPLFFCERGNYALQ
jgi:hypothetical protein